MEFIVDSLLWLLRAILWIGLGYGILAFFYYYILFFLWSTGITFNRKKRKNRPNGCNITINIHVDEHEQSLNFKNNDKIE